MLTIEQSFLYETVEMLLITIARSRTGGGKVTGRQIPVEQAVEGVTNLISKLLGDRVEIESEPAESGEPN